MSKWLLLLGLYIIYLFTFEVKSQYLHKHCCQIQFHAQSTINEVMNKPALMFVKLSEKGAGIKPYAGRVPCIGISYFLFILSKNHFYYFICFLLKVNFLQLRYTINCNKCKYFLYNFIIAI